MRVKSDDDVDDVDVDDFEEDFFFFFSDSTSNIHFNISGDNGGTFTVRVADGACTVTEGLDGTPKCVITTKDSIYEGIELGKENPQMAVMMGKIKLTNIAEMLTFTGLFERLY